MKTIAMLIVIIILVGAAILGAFSLMKFNLNQNNFRTLNFPSCTSGPLLDVSPVPLDKVVTLTPLGQFSPPDHVFPPPHQYFYVIDFRNPKDVHVPVYAPGNMMLIQIGLRHYNHLGNKTNYIDYTLVFMVCDSFEIYFHHVTTLQYQPFVDAAAKILATCTFSKDRNEDYCQGDVNIPVASGHLIGSTGDIAAGVYGMDIGARDYRIPNGKDFVDSQRHCQGNVFDRCYTVCAFDYFPNSVKNQFKFTSSDFNSNGNVQCGNIYGDVANTAQGYWFKKGSTQTIGEFDDLFIGPNNPRPETKVFSVGTAIPSLSPGLYAFTPVHSGFVNTDPAEVKYDGSVYCYDLDRKSVIIQLTSSTSLKIEGVSSSCGNGPWTFTNPVEFER